MDIHVLDYKDIIPTLCRPVSEDQPMFKEYLYKGRQDILVNTDIFCSNVRSKSLTEANFSLFDRTPIDDAEVIIFPIYLELFEFLGLRENIKHSIETYSSKYPDKKVVFFWNHDRDFKEYNDTTSKYKNCRVINYNTSERTDNDIIVPFWTMENINPIEEEKEIYCSFAGNITHPIRGLMVNNIIEYDTPEFQYLGALPYEEYRKKLSQTVFSLCPRGAGLSSYRFFECIHANTIPVLIADDVVLPYEEDLYYPDFSIRCKEEHITDMGVLHGILQSVDYDKMLKRLKEVRHRFTLTGVQEYVHGRLK